jgi:hypothetical protein
VRIFRLTVLLSLLAIAPAAQADVRTETAARQAMKKAHKDFVSAKYAAGITKLRTALKACGTKKCSDEVRADLLRDLGAQQFRKGDTKGSKKSWSSALALVPSLTLSATYDSPDVHEAFEGAKGSGGGGAPGETKPGTAGAATTGSPQQPGEVRETTKGEPDAKADTGQDRGVETAAVGRDLAKPTDETNPGTKPRRRLWIGISGTIDFGHLPAGQDVCKLAPNGQPFNTGDYYCAYNSGSDFPSRNPNNPTNALLQQGQSGNVADQFVVGNARLLLSLDYALSQNFLLGLRAGLVFSTYPGGSPTLSTNETSGAAFNDGKAFSPAWLHLELRATYVFGNDPLTQSGVAPMVFVGGGAAEFDQHVSDTVTLSDGSSGPVRIWRTDGPLFLLAGAGARWALSENFALTAAVRANVALSPLLMPTIGPEIGFQYGL